MWQVLLAAAVAGSTGFVAKHLLTPANADPPLVPNQCKEKIEDPDSLTENANLEDPISSPLVVPSGFYESGSESNSQAQDGIFRFSSSESLRQRGFRSRTHSFRKKPVFGHRGSKNMIRVAEIERISDAKVPSEQRRVGRRLPFCLKRRKTCKNLAGKSGSFASKDRSLFGWGLSFGIMCTMSAGKSEINKLNRAMNETSRVVQDIKSELNRRKSSHLQQIRHSANITDISSRKVSGQHDEVMLEKTKSEPRGTDVKILNFPAREDGECGSSALTEEPDRRFLEMDQLEAELEFELQQLPGCNIDSPCHEEMRPTLQEFQVPNEGCPEANDQNSNSVQSHGVLASELNQKLSHLLIEQQGNQIADLESELQLAQSKLHEKETELQALKDCVRRLTELSLSTVSDDEIETCADQKGTGEWDSEIMDSESKQTVIGVKRSINSESCAYYLK